MKEDRASRFHDDTSDMSSSLEADITDACIEGHETLNEDLASRLHDVSSTSTDMSSSLEQADTMDASASNEEHDKSSKEEEEKLGGGEDASRFHDVSDTAVASSLGPSLSTREFSLLIAAMSS